MLGLLYKDFYTAKKELLLTGFMALIFNVLNVVVVEQELLAPSIGVLISVGSLVPTYSIHYDKANNWNKFVCASPLSRTKVVLSKYIAGIASIVVMNLLIVLDNVAGVELPGVPVPDGVCPSGDDPRVPEAGAELCGGGVHGHGVRANGHSVRSEPPGRMDR